MSWGGVRLIDWIYPVGHIITSSNPEFNPNLIYRTTTWERYAAGKTLVGVDDTDDDFNSVGKTGGEKTHQLTRSEIPAHYHNMREYGNTCNMYTNSKSTSTSGDIFVRKLTAANGFVSSVSDTDTYRLRTEDLGGGKAHNNMPPYITVYFWRRTA